MTYNSQTISGYNDTPPPDDGSAVASNQVKWDFVKTKIGDPVRVLAENINAELLTAFQQLLMGSFEDKATLFTVSATNDGGTVFNCTQPFTVTLPAAADAGNGFNLVVLNNSGGTIVVDGASAETINGSATVSLIRDLDAFVLVCDGTLWKAMLLQADVLGANNAFTGNNTFSGTSAFSGANTHTATVTWSKGADVASGTALPVLTDGNAFDVTGTTQIDTIDTLGVGTIIKLHFDGILTLAHDATDLILPTGVDITTAAGDEAEFIEYATGDWRCTNYSKADGFPLIGNTTVGTPQATTSGTAFNFTGIPPWATKIIVTFAGNSLSGTDHILIQIGDSGGIETSGYSSSSTNLVNGSTDSSTAGFIVRMNSAAAVISGGAITLSIHDSSTFTWVASGSTARSDSATGSTCAGDKSLSATLTQVTITRDGTDTFDAGSVNVTYE